MAASGSSRVRMSTAHDSLAELTAMAHAQATVTPSRGAAPPPCGPGEGGGASRDGRPKRWGPSASRPRVGGAGGGGGGDGDGDGGERGGGVPPSTEAGGAAAAGGATGMASGPPGTGENPTSCPQLARHDSLQALSGMAALESEDAMGRSASPASPDSSFCSSSEEEGASSSIDGSPVLGCALGGATSASGGAGGALTGPRPGVGGGAAPGEAAPSAKRPAVTATSPPTGEQSTSPSGVRGEDPLSELGSPKGAVAPERKKPKKKPKVVTEEDTPRDGSIVVHGVDGDGRQRIVRVTPGQTLLALSGMGLKGVSLDALTTSVDVAHSITEVTLAANELDYVDLSPLAWCPRLVALSLNGNALLRVDLAPLGACEKLERIWLHGNQLERVDLAPLAACTALRSLYLDKNRLDDVSVDLGPLARLPTLRSLRLGGNKLGGFLDVAPLVTSKLSLIDVDGSVTLVASTAAVSNVTAPALRKRAGSISWVTPTPRPLQRSGGRGAPANGGGSSGGGTATSATSRAPLAPSNCSSSLDGEGGQAAASALPPTPPAGVNGAAASVILPANGQARRVGLVRSSPPPSAGRSPPPHRPVPQEPAPRTFVFSSGGAVSPPSPFVSDGSHGLLRHPKRDAGGHGLNPGSCINDGPGGTMDGNAPRVGSLLSANGVPVSAADPLGLSPASRSNDMGMSPSELTRVKAAPSVIHVLLIGFRRLSRYAVEDTLIACGRVMIDALTLEGALKDASTVRRAHVVLVQAPGIEALQRVTRVAGAVPVFVIGSERYRNTPAGDAAVAAGATFCHDPLAKDDGQRVFSSAVRFARNSGGAKPKAAVANKADAADPSTGDADLDAARLSERMAVEAAFADLGNEASLDELGDVAKAVGLPRCAAPMLFRAARHMQSGRGVLSSRVDLESFMRLWRTTLAPERDSDARLYVLLASPRSPAPGVPGVHDNGLVRARTAPSSTSSAAGGRPQDLLTRKMSQCMSQRCSARSGGAYRSRRWKRSWRPLWTTSGRALAPTRRSRWRRRRSLARRR
eukprot:TRINITY_DN3132_c0_g1_i5.p1 TRINITY_DN3132_c0_g1~~TRINITY_DN3132_c0_g1_i5.p1  ORF type:complete len:1031 (+),score=294.41 TRINITY_DN3132_c0_g1_i5:896-3988(+)